MRTLLISSIAAVALCASVSSQSLSTTFANNFGGGSNWSVFFDINVTSSINVLALDLNVNSATGALGHVDLYMTAAGGTHVNNEEMPVWTQVASTVPTAGRGAGTPTSAVLASPLMIAPGSYGVAVNYQGSFAPLTSIGNGMNQTFSNSEMTITAGTLTIRAPGVASVITFDPRVWNGTFYYNFFATAERVGQSCGSAPMDLAVGDRPILGSVATVETREIPPASLATVLLVGLTGQSTPVDLTPIGMTGCGLHTSAAFSRMIMATSGSEVHSFTLGNDPMLVGQEVWLQSAAVVLGENPFGIILSNGVRWSVDRQ